MNDDLMSLAVREFGICVDDLAVPGEARSGAGAHPARKRDGLPQARPGQTPGAN